MTAYVNPAIVIGGEHNALGIIRNLGQQGVATYCVLPDHQQFAHVSKYCKGFTIVPRLQEDTGVMHQWLQQVSERAAHPIYVHPTSDLSVLTLSRVLPQLPRCVATIPPVQAVETCVIKRRFYTSLADYGMPHPATFYSNDVPIEDIVAQLRFPVYIKPSISQIFVQAFRRKGFVAYTLQELQSYLRLVLHRGIDVMIQEIIPGPITDEYVLRGYFNRASELMGLHVMQGIRSRPFSVSSAQISVPVTAVREIAPRLMDYLTSLHYHGPFVAEVKRDARDGQFKLLEVNARSGAGNAHGPACGFNHILLGYREAIGEPITPITHYTSNIYSTDMLSDMLTVFTLLRQGALSWTTLLRSYTQKRADWLFQWRDLAPFLKQLHILFTRVRNGSNTQETVTGDGEDHARRGRRQSGRGNSTFGRTHRPLENS